MKQSYRVGVDADIVTYKACSVKMEYDAIRDGKILDTFPSAKLYKEWFEALPLKMQEVTEREAVPLAKSLDDATDACNAMMFTIRNRLNATSMHPFLTSNDKSNFRYALATHRGYKEHRKDVSKPAWYDEIRQHLVDNWGAEVIYGMEADDALAGFQQFHYDRLMDGEGCDTTDVSCIASIDKDLLMVPGYHYNWDRHKLQYVTKEQGLRTFYLQLLTGDVGTDNIPGLFQLTKQRCTANIKNGLKNLHTAEEMYNYVEDVYMTASGEDYVYTKYLYEIGNLLYMRRHLEDEWVCP